MPAVALGSAQHHAKREFSIKVGSLCEDSPIGLDKWLTTLWLLTNCKNGISSCEIARDVKVTQKTAWFMLHRIRLALQDESFGKLGGEVEVDETFIGGKARNMHLDVKQRRITGTGGKDKAIVFGALERGGKVRTVVVADRKRSALQTCVKEHVEAGAASTPMLWHPTMAWRKNMLTRLLTMPRNMLMGRFIPTASKTSGRC